MEIAAKKLIVALDDLDFSSALRLVELTKDYASTFKVGSALFTAYGPKIVKEIRDFKVDIFLDLKFHDIPMQVKKAVENALVFSPRFLTVHALGGKKMLRDAQAMVEGSDTTLLAVSILTSHSEEDLKELGFFGSIADAVSTLTDIAFSSGVHGFVASAHEARNLKATYGNECFVVCPGVRLKKDAKNDQARVMSPKDAILAGADALVVGRSITHADNVVIGVRAVHDEIVDALACMSLREKNVSGSEAFI